MPFEEHSQRWTPYHVFGDDRPARWLVLCDHASNLVPGSVNGGDLGLSPTDMARHIAFDVGAAGLALRLAELLDAPAILSNFSRLVIDPNRGEDDPTLVMRLYDGTIVPANRHIDEVEIQRRLEQFYRPYHAAVESLAARQSDTVILSVHSFTPRFRHREPRPWHVGLLFAEDDRLSRPLIDLLRREGGLVVGENQPYSGYLDGDTIDRHAISHGRQNTLIEVRNDLIADDAGQTAWADRFARLLPDALVEAEARGTPNGRPDPYRT